MTSLKRDRFCGDCGQELLEKELEGEGLVPFCPNCQSFRFPMFSSAISAIVLNENRDKILLIKQYGMDQHILVAGYVSQGEAAEETLAREIKEELGVELTSLSYNRSHYYQPSNTLMLNFTVTVKGQVTPNHEIDDWSWFSIKEAKDAIKDGSLAETFLLDYLNK